MKIFFLLLNMLPFCCTAQKEVSKEFVKIPAIFTTDTVHNGQKIYLITNICFAKDTVSIKAIYNYPDSNFSFYEIQLFDTLEVYLNGTAVRLNSRIFKPFMREYIYGYNFVNILNKNSEKKILLFGQLKFCNGWYCSAISVLSISAYSKDSSSCMEVESGFCDEDILMDYINKQYMKTGKLEIPVTDDLRNGKTVKNWITDKAR